MIELNPNYKSIIDSVEDYAINLLDDKWNVISWNKGAQKILGYTAEEVIGKNIRMFFTAESLEQMQPEQQIKEIREKGVIMREGWRVRKNGELFWGDILISALNDIEKNITGYSVIVRDVTKKKKERDFDNSNLHALINNTHDQMWSVDTNYNLITSNDAFNEIVKELLGRTIKKGDSILSVGFSEEQLARFRQRYDRSFKGESFTEIEYTAQYEYWSEISFHPISEDGKIVGTACHGHSITKRVLAERKICHLNRLYSFISQINHAIVHCKNEQHLFNEVCGIAVSVGKFKVAWIGNVCRKERTVSLVAETGFINMDLSLFANAPCIPGGPADTVLNTGSYVVYNNVSTDLNSKGWKIIAEEHKFRSCMVLPIMRSGEIIATFNLYAGETGYFNEEEISLLQKATDDLSFAMESFENERLKLMAEEKLKHDKFRMKQAQAIAHFGSWELNFETGIVIWSDEACRIYGLSPQENKQSYASWISFIHPDDLKHVMKITKEAEATRSNVSFYHRIVTRDDNIRQLRSHAHYEFDAAGKPIGLYGVAHDITEQMANIIQLKSQNEQLEDIAWIQSHKVRGPLATILGLAQQFKESDSTEETAMIVQGILTTAQKLDIVIHEIVERTETSEICSAFNIIPQ